MGFQILLFNITNILDSNRGVLHNELSKNIDTYAF